MSRTMIARAWVPAAFLAWTTAVFAADPAPPPQKASPAFGNPGFANPDTPGLMEGSPAGDVVNATDITFLQQLSLGNRAEVELGKLAVGRSEAAGVDGFGNRMVKDHGAAARDLEGLARSADVVLPKSLGPEQQKVRAELDKLQGRAFDQRYLASQVTDHQKATQLLIYEIGQGQHSGVREFASKTLPAVMEHLEHAQALHLQMTAGPTQQAMR